MIFALLEKRGVWAVSLIACVLLGGATLRMHRSSNAARQKLEQKRQELEGIQMKFEAVDLDPVEPVRGSSQLDSSVLGVLDRIETYATQTGIECSEVSVPGGTEEKARIYRIVGSGEAGEVISFFGKIEQDRGPLAIHEMRVWAGKEVQRVGTLAFNISVMSPTEDYRRGDDS